MPRIEMTYAGTDYRFNSLYTDAQAVRELQGYIDKGRVWSKKARALARQNTHSPEDMVLVRFFIHRADSYVGPERCPTRPTGRRVKRWGGSHWFKR